ncbi:addiction module antidote protein [Bradyrhizobium sp. UFLA05-109]
MIAKQSIRSSRTNRRVIAERINGALETGDIVEICHAIGAATRQHNIADLARRAGIERTSLYRAFAGEEKHPNFSTVLHVLGAMGFELRVIARQNAQARNSGDQTPQPPTAFDLD